MIVGKIQSRFSGEIETAAKEPILRDIYNKPENPAFPRSENTLEAVSVEYDDANETITVFLDEDVNRPFDYTYFNGIEPEGLKSFHALKDGADEIYPQYFMRGGGFTGVEFDFYREWEESLIPVIEKALNEVVEAIVDNIK